MSQVCLFCSYAQDGDAPIHLAAYRGFPNIFTKFLNLGIDIDIVGEVSLFVLLCSPMARAQRTSIFHDNFILIGSMMW